MRRAAPKSCTAFFVTYYGQKNEMYNIEYE